MVRGMDSTAPVLPFDLARIRAQFPILNERVHGHDLVYLDNAATTQKPLAVINSLVRYYTQDNANIHRGVHALSQRATDAYEQARARVARFLNAARHEEIVFVRGATEGINLVAHSFLRGRLAPGDVVLLTGMEHHANIVPWQLVAEAVGARVMAAPVLPDGQLDREAWSRMLREHPVRLAAFVHVSNALGTINPVASLIAEARGRGVVTLLDAAQSTPHFPVDVQALGCDFCVFSGHKVFAPTGIGALYGRYQLLEAMAPYQGGGDMILKVSFERTTFKAPPERFEAGTPDIAGVVGLGAALEWLETLDRAGAHAHEERLRRRAEALLLEIPGLRLVGTAPEKAGVVSFVMEQAHPHDIGTFLDQRGVAIRAGHHCTQPLMKSMNLPGTARASFAFYNTEAEVEALAAALRETARFFG